jgi:hypothetical protein
MAEAKESDGRIGALSPAWGEGKPRIGTEAGYRGKYKQHDDDRPALETVYDIARHRIQAIEVVSECESIKGRIRAQDASDEEIRGRVCCVSLRHLVPKLNNISGQRRLSQQMIVSPHYTHAAR